VSTQEYWQGLIDAQTQHTRDTLNEIKEDVKLIKKEMHSLSLFKAKVYGFAGACSVFFHLLMRKLLP